MTGSDDPLFEDIYRSAGEDLASIPWATLAPNPTLQEWLNTQPAPNGAPALVVACGLGDDAEELARRGYRVTAFDFSPTAIEQCRRRFPSSPVDYLVADLFDLPTDWTESFDVVVEIRTLQSLPLDDRPQGARAIANTIAPGGRLFVRTAKRNPDEPLTSRPWPLTRNELEPFVRAGLTELELSDEPARDGRFATFTAVYQRPRTTT
ncbi:MAG TPA: class I SAM-dependent methyltransferase [Solirubrobacteraceae bacterium]|nr:class I SAM-dependent methyltransferase [Solirubrobacteraceae bacterium]